MNKAYLISCFPKAVFGHNGKISLSFSSADTFTTSASVFADFNEEDMTIRVPCMTLPQIFEENDLPNPDLLKMDCEGAEYSILYNCHPDYLTRIMQMVTEVHKGSSPRENIQTLAEYLKDHGFNLRIRDHMLWAWRR